MNELQKRELNILKEMLKVIERHDLRYFAIGGTCLGAIRHNGFIPWDDDIDIAMPRKDYDLFRTLYYDELPDYIKKIDYDNRLSYDNLFFKIHDTRTTYIETSAIDNPDIYNGAFVDTMPIDGFPSKMSKQYLLTGICIVFSKMNKLVRPISSNHKEKAGQIKVWARIVLRKIFKYNYFSTKIAQFLSKYNYDDSQYIYFTWRSQRHIGEYKRLFKRKYFEGYQEIKFEDISIRVPINYHEYLTEEFGEYMRLPPAESRHSTHDVLICDMNMPCSFYAGLAKKGLLKL